MEDDQLTRLVDDPGGSALGRSLIASSQADVPSPDGRARAARRLGIVAGLAVGTGAGSEVGALAAVWKLAAVVVALGGVVGLAVWHAPASERAPAEAPRAVVQAAPAPRGDRGGVAETMPSVSPVPAPPPVGAAPSPAPRVAPPRPAPPRPSARAEQVAAPAPVSARPAPGGETEAVVARDPPDPRDPRDPPDPRDPRDLPPSPGVEASASAPVSAPAPEPPASPPAEVAAGPGRLAAEVALVDRARTSLGAGDYPAAHAALAEYHQRFAGGDLDAEAEVVTIELLIAEREIVRARTLGAAFLARNPRSPLAQRVHSLLDHLPK